MIAAADVNIAGFRFAVVSVHALAASVAISDGIDANDHTGLRRVGLELAWHNDVIVAVLEPGVVGRRFIVGRDWNNSPLFDVNYPPRRARLHSRAPSSSRRADAGWHDAMRRFHDSDVRTYLDQESAPYELDHVFVDATTYDDLLDCHALNESTFHGLSDHAPLVCDFAVESNDSDATTSP